eukprot:5984894-Karenia_brevis.AAC.1
MFVSEANLSMNPLIDMIQAMPTVMINTVMVSHDGSHMTMLIFPVNTQLGIMNNGTMIDDGSHAKITMLMLTHTP